MNSHISLVVGRCFVTVPSHISPLRLVNFELFKFFLLLLNKKLMFTICRNNSNARFNHPSSHPRDFRPLDWPHQHQLLS